MARTRSGRGKSGKEADAEAKADIDRASTDGHVEKDRQTDKRGKTSDKDRQTHKLVFQVQVFVSLSTYNSP